MNSRTKNAARTDVERRVSERLLRMPEVAQRVGLSNSTIYLKVAQGQFPRPIKVGATAVRWRESEVDQWIADCIAADAHRHSETGKGPTPQPPRQAKPTGPEA
ncbi:transcriptional regulator, AlpA family [Paraburkholderia fungorum]|uniref:Transcriptional regulator, AlpA family n=1 Tax=Paraburkholderia fungorum TaxID=134537 RepID=A0A1H1JP16_9BURK|nr:AlpA family transcriptional regulator [Paraburkholderia fungorum]SDR51157.1 transcriptional regulator, AlpA family [Paraburkholderia fungorum]